MQRGPRYEILELKDIRLLKWTVVTAAALFGVVSSSCSAGRMGTVTTMVTGHVLTVSNLLGCWLYGGLEDLQWQRLWTSLAVLAGNVLGGCLGSWAMTRTGVKALLFPLPFVIYVLIYLHDHLAKPRAWIQRVHEELQGKAEGKDSEDDRDEVETQDYEDLESQGSEPQASPNSEGFLQSPPSDKETPRAFSP